MSDAKEVLYYVLALINVHWNECSDLLILQYKAHLMRYDTCTSSGSPLLSTETHGI